MAGATNIKLFTYPLAFNPQKAKLVLEEKRTPYREENINLFNGQSLSPRYLRINPNGTVPTIQIQEGGKERLITQTLDIVKYVNEQGPPLGHPTIDQSLANEWATSLHEWDGNLFAGANGDAGLKKILSDVTDFKIKYAEARLRDSSLADLKDVYTKKIAGMKEAGAETQDAAIVAKNSADLTALLDKAEAQLSKSKFLAGDAYSVADVMFTPILYRIGMVKQEEKYLAPHPKVQQYYSEVQKRPSYNVAFGPASSKLTALKWVLPAILKVNLAKLTGRY